MDEQTNRELQASPRKNPETVICVATCIAALFTVDKIELT